MKNRIIFFILSIFTFTPIFAQYVSSLAGAGAAGFKDGTGVLAQFAYPQATAVDTAGNIFVADFGNHCIRKVTKDGKVSTFAGTPQASGLINGSALQAKFYNPSGIALDDSGNVYVSDCQNNCIRKITKTTMLVSTLAGSSTSGANNGQGSAASFSKPQGIAIDGGRNIIVADLEKNIIRKITPSGLVTTRSSEALASLPLWIRHLAKLV